MKPKLRVVLKDEKGKAYADKRYTLSIDGKKPIEGTTAPDGMIEQEVPANAEQGDLLLQVDDARTLHFPLHLGKLSPIEEISGVKARLRHLGYYEGPIDEVVDRRTWTALRMFQRDEGLDVTGKPTSETRDRLKTLHGG